MGYRIIDDTEFHANLRKGMCHFAHNDVVLLAIPLDMHIMAWW